MTRNPDKMNLSRHGSRTAYSWMIQGKFEAQRTTELSFRIDLNFSFRLEYTAQFTLTSRDTDNVTMETATRAFKFARIRARF